jgi:hypothetical protein
MITKENKNAVDAVLNRVMELGVYNERFNAFMDIDNALSDSDNGWANLFAFDDANFAHDIYGIRENINRKTKQLDNYFMPRCA